MNNQRNNPNNGYNTYQQNRQGKPTQSSQGRKKKLRFKPNKDGMIALAILILIVAVAITLVTLTITAIIGAVTNVSEETTPVHTEEIIVPEAKWNDGFTVKTVANTGVSEGDLILVNFEHAYAEALSENLTLYTLAGTEGYSNYFVCHDYSTTIRSSIATQLKALAKALKEACADTMEGEYVLFNSGFRSYAKQQSLYDNKTSDNYVALPGHSEHHTGLAVDIQIFNKDKRTVQLRDAELAWMEAHCAEYGFVIRYDGSKFEKTGILDEPWHYRYVGVAHATYMMESGLCLEEYLELLKTSHTYEQEPLTITADETEYLVYYVAASAEETTTLVPVPPESVGKYTISGDNMNGFIVTVKKPSPAAESTETTAASAN